MTASCIQEQIHKLFFLTSAFQVKTCNVFFVFCLKLFNYFLHFDRRVYIAQNIVRLLSNECARSMGHSAQNKKTLLYSIRARCIICPFTTAVVDECVRISQSTLDCNLLRMCCVRSFSPNWYPILDHGYVSWYSAWITKKSRSVLIFSTCERRFIVQSTDDSFHYIHVDSRNFSRKKLAHLFY